MSLPKGNSYLATTARVRYSLFFFHFLDAVFRPCFRHLPSGFSVSKFAVHFFFFRFLLGIALSSHYGLHTGKEGADRKGVSLRGLAPFLGQIMHELQLKNFRSTTCLDGSDTMPSGTSQAAKRRRTSAEGELQNGKSNKVLDICSKVMHYLAG